jgi:hypothetical protein
LQYKEKMRHPDDALHQLHAIRSLMERATTYRAISAAGALVAALLTLTLAAAQLLTPPSSPTTFLAPWLAVLALASLANLALLHREARSQGRPFFSASMRMALVALCPPLLAAGLLGINLAYQGGPYHLTVAIWMVGYGLAHLASAPFAPRSLVALGLAFFVSGLALSLASPIFPTLPPARSAALLMAASFGLVHLAYAAAIWRRRPARHDPSPLLTQLP